MSVVIFVQLPANTNKKAFCTKYHTKGFQFVPGAGLEPARHCCHWCLRPTRLPIPPPGHFFGNKQDANLNITFVYAKKKCKSQILKAMSNG